MIKLAVFGNPIKHSRSPWIHQRFAEQFSLAVDYRAIEAPLDDFRGCVESFLLAGGVGGNVTVPFKQQAFAMATRLSERAQKAGAVNTLYLKDNKLCGDNTDGIGLLNDLQRNLGWELAGKKVLVLGAGGAVRGILQPLLDAKPASVVIANRSAEKAAELAELFRGAIDIDGGGFTLLQDQSADIVINAISAGLHGEMPELPASFSLQNTRCYDMVYSSKTTPFCQWALRKGASQCHDGIGMLVEQAAAAFAIWTGKQPQTTSVIAELKLLLASESKPS